MKPIITILMMMAFGSSLLAQVEYDSFTDRRDGRRYLTIRSGDQVWMAENLAYVPGENPDPSDSLISGHTFVFGYDGHDADLVRGTDYYKYYGVTYDWQAAQAACPKGWRLPTEKDWFELTNNLSPNAGYKLKSTTGWKGYRGNGDNSTGFNAFPAGFRGSDGNFYRLGTDALFWSSAPVNDGESAVAVTFSWRNTSVFRVSLPRANGASVRCIKSPSAWQEL
jgi:uncharacterized protein (TIGR02145 family)